ncbi:hypothetical protein LXM25_18995 [Dyadobacter sp. LJ53]|uniref:hypothetical protein n=1 Tax=Dyadobacter chenwenxiniae TaxID=2906456 RepID=UPI001F1DCAE5|nr:hypothetical protein [Dyadobacter chenwenxiniae]MCF0052162.1 hypothetical protein [Dyadobacter chenwenxiniae]
MRVIVLCILCLFSIASCNQVNRLEPIEPEPVPGKVIEQIKQWYPNAENMVFKPLLEKLVWEVKFDEGADKYSTLADSTKIWETYRFSSENPPSKLLTLVGNSAFKGGTFSANRDQIGTVAPDQRNRLIYNLQGNDYSFNWVLVDNRIAGAAFEETLYWILYEDMSVLPQQTQTYIHADPNIKFVSVEVKISLNYTKSYNVLVSFDKDGVKTYANLLFNEAGDIKWFSRAFNEPDDPNSLPNFDELPDAIQEYIDASPELAGFTTQPVIGMKWMGEYRNAKCYTLRYLNNTTFDFCDLQFDGEGKLVNKSYFIYFQ